jgi:alpha-tubulin suppressor-like RCC1 family protein
VTQVSCSHQHAAAITDRGQLYTWGSGDALGLGDDVRSASSPTLVRVSDVTFTRVSCGSASTVCAASSGVYAFGSNADGQLGHGVGCKSQLRPRLISKD